WVVPRPTLRQMLICICAYWARWVVVRGFDEIELEIQVVNALADVAGHIVDAVGACVVDIAANGRCVTDTSVLAQLSNWVEVPLHVVGPIAGGRLVTPREQTVIGSTRSLLPLRLGRQTLSGPPAIRICARPIYMNDGVGCI